jgi:hypothetical protein
VCDGNFAGPACDECTLGFEGVNCTDVVVVSSPVPTQSTTVNATTPTTPAVNVTTPTTPITPAANTTTPFMANSTSSVNGTANTTILTTSTVVPTTPVPFHDVLSQAWIDNTAAERFFVPSYDVPQFVSTRNTEQVGAGGFMFVANDTSFVMAVLESCGREAYVYDEIPLAPEMCESGCGWSIETWFKAGFDNYHDNDTLVNIPNDTDTTGRNQYGYPGTSYPIDETRLVLVEEDQAIISFYTDITNGVTFNVLIINGEIVVRWGDFSWLTTVHAYENLWTHISVAYHEYDGRLVLYVHYPGLVVVQDVYVGVIAGCNMRLQSVLSIGRVIEAIDGYSYSFHGHIDETRYWNYPRNISDIESQYYYAILRPEDNLVLVISYDDTTSIGGKYRVSQFGPDGTRCSVRAEVVVDPTSSVAPADVVPFDVSNSPIVFSNDVGCEFVSDDLKQQAIDTCDTWFYSGVLSQNCSSLGAEVEFYHKACVCEIAKHRQIEYHKPAVCMFASHCSAVMDTPEEFLESYCVADVYDDDDDNTQFSLTDANWLFIITVVSTLVCLVFLIIWFIVVRMWQNNQSEINELDDDDALDMELGDLSKNDADVSFINPMFDMDPGEAANPMLLAPDYVAAPANPLFNSGDNANYQQNEMDLLQLDWFEPDLTPPPPGQTPTAPIATQPPPFHEIDVHPPPPGPANFLIAATLTAIEQEEWMRIEVEVNDQDCSFIVDGKDLGAQRLAAPVWDAVEGDMSIGQREPGRFPFHGQMKTLRVYESHLESQGEEKPPVSVLNDDYTDLLVNGENLYDAVEIRDECFVFTGTTTSYLSVPPSVHPDVKTHFKIDCEIRPTKDCKGYIVAKTDPSATTRYWALAICRSP